MTRVAVVPSLTRGAPVRLLTRAVHFVMAGTTTVLIGCTLAPAGYA